MQTKRSDRAIAIKKTA